VSTQPKGNQQQRSRRKRPGSGGNGVRSMDNNAPCLGAQRYFSGELNAFELFCAYHLGIDRDGAVRNHNLSDVARRFGVDRAGLDAALTDFNMDRERVRRASFDLEMARLDVAVVPPGVDRVEVARSIYSDFLAAGCGVGPLPVGRVLPGESEPELD
jgi:hypothetical protein